MKLNQAAVRYLSGLIRAGHVVPGAWSFSAADGNRLLDSDNDRDGGATRDTDTDAAQDHDWPAFANVHLGIDEQAAPKTKARYGYPCAKKNASGQVVVYLHGLLGAISRAGQQGETEIEAAARRLYSAALKKRSANDSTALCMTLAAVTDPEALKLPEWRTLIPAPDAEGTVRGEDGRSWKMRAPNDVAAAFSRPLPIDTNHALQRRAPLGEESPAFGWIEQLRVAANGAIEGLIEWTGRGVDALNDRAYRFFSPVFDFNPDSGEILQLVSAALTNTPNLPGLALNDSLDDPEPEVHTVDEEIRKALGLNDQAKPADAVAAIARLKSEREAALNDRGTPSLNDYVPRADYDKAVERATGSERALNDMRKSNLEAEVDAEIGKALEAGKITPATKDYHRAQCMAEGGLERFRDFVKAAPEVGADTGLDTRTAEERETALNDAERKVASLFGNSEEDIRKYGKGETA